MFKYLQCCACFSSICSIRLMGHCNSSASLSGTRFFWRAFFHRVHWLEPFPFILSGFTRDLFWNRDAASHIVRSSIRRDSIRCGRNVDDKVSQYRSDGETRLRQRDSANGRMTGQAFVIARCNLRQLTVAYTAENLKKLCPIDSNAVWGVWLPSCSLGFDYEKVQFSSLHLQRCFSGASTSAVPRSLRIREVQHRMPSLIRYLP